MDKVHIIVGVSQPEKDKVVVEVGFYPNERKLGIEATTHALASAISLLIKAEHQYGNIKDYKLMEEIINHLNSEFISNEVFNDIMFNKKSFE